MSSQDHYNATEALLARGILTARVFDAVRLNGASPVRDDYAILTDETPLRAAGRYTALTTPGSRTRHRFDVRSVGRTAAKRREFRDAVEVNLLSNVPVVAGRECSPIQPVPPVEEGQPEYDKAANLYHVTDSFEYWSWEAN